MPLEMSRGDDGDAAGRAAAFLDLVFPPPRAFAIRLWDGQVLAAKGAPAFTIVLTSPGSLRRMFRVPIELSLGEAYLRGDFEIEGDLVAAFSLPHIARGIANSPRVAASLLLQLTRLPRDPDSARLQTRGPALLRGREHSRERDEAAIQYHYDVGNDFYRLFLDRRMVYSCAYFTSSDQSLDAAQEAKLDHICRKLMLSPGQRLLDVGCGWGALLIHAAEHYGVVGVGVTLSDKQHDLARERVAEAGLGERITILKRDYRDLDGETFDRVVSVGMFEHVGRAHFAEYFQQIHSLLRPGGLFLNHSIANQPSPRRGPVASWLNRTLLGNETFRRRYIFPDGELAPVSVANLVGETAGFEVRDVENLREHYALTVRHWLERLRARRDDAIRLAGPAMFRLWEMYLAAAVFHFETGRTNINQTLFLKSPDGRSPLPLTRDHLYERHLASQRRSSVPAAARPGQGNGAGVVAEPASPA